MTGVKWWVMFLCEHKKSDCVAAKEHETSRDIKRIKPNIKGFLNVKRIKKTTLIFVSLEITFYLCAAFQDKGV